MQVRVLLVQQDRQDGGSSGSERVSHENEVVRVRALVLKPRDCLRKGLGY